ncbi:Alpha/Beta hydrolase protein [Vararia minispora EC-137]|uniref:Alpha/Beta hydrolase protein n=1 Tax=Vararia minispora EC-137 TaxID=1314806 RepID=A0ACB8QXT9_9AGAM|nr:Alpha/Beta hydrolase protein [Vararia minispora EC-137]
MAPPVKAHDFALRDGPDVFAPKDLIELARPGVGVANAPGTLVLVPVSKYSFVDKKNNKSLVVASLDSKAQLEIPLPKGGEAFWLGPTTLGHVIPDSDSKISELYAIDIHVETETVTPEPPALLGSFPTTSATNFVYSPKAGTIVFSDYVYADGDLTHVKEGDEEWANRGNTAYVYDEGYERHWDTWIGPKRPSLFTVKLTHGPDGKWTFGGTFTNVLNGTGHQVPVEPFGGTDDFAVSDTHIVYTTKDPVLPEAWHTKQNARALQYSSTTNADAPCTQVYIIPVDGGGAPRELTSGKQGATHNPVFNPSGDLVAWLELDKDGHEADRAKVVIFDLKKGVRYTLTQPWDRSPDGLSFSPDAPILFLTAGDHARGKVFALPIPPTPDQSSTHPALPPRYTTPRALTSEGAATGIQALPGGRLLFSHSSLQRPNDIFLFRNLSSLGLSVGEAERITSLTEEALKGYELRAPEDIYFEGAEGKTIHGFVIKPRGWTKEDKKATWPVALLIHGGPESAWDDRWSTRWNHNVFAQQGYFTVILNPTGSTTFGQELTDAIQEDWGGKPFVDMQKGWKHVLATYPEIDTERAVGAGASWGGYAINWIQGHPEYGFNFKALFCHDGVFDATYNGFSTDELFFFNNEWGGRPWEPHAAEILKKYNAREFVHKWSTPMLIVHGSKDYRLPETDGIAAYHALKQQGIAARLVIFPDENHWVLNHGNSLKWHYEVFRWFDLYVGKDTNDTLIVREKLYD